MKPSPGVQDPDDSPIDRFGNLSLDFVNTRLLGRGGPIDALESPEGLLAWLGRVEDPSLDMPLPQGMPDRRTLLAEARVLRSAIVDALEATAAGSAIPPSTSFALNRAIGFTTVEMELETTAEGTRLIRRHTPVHPAAVLSPIAIAAAELLTTAPPERLRRCHAAGCPRWFLDTSKGGRRRWCSMATCGNRTKAARFRRSRRGEGS